MKNYHFNEVATLNISVLPSEQMIHDNLFAEKYSWFKVVEIEYIHSTEPEMDPWYKSIIMWKECIVR